MIKLILRFLSVLIVLLYSSLSYSQLNSEPMFKGSDYQWGFIYNVKKHIDEHLEKPRFFFSEFENSVEIQFLITKEGSTDSIEVLSSHSCHLDEAAVNVINELPEMIPAMKNGIPLDYKCSIIIYFSNDPFINQNGPPVRGDWPCGGDITVAMLACYLECFPD